MRFIILAAILMAGSAYGAGLEFFTKQVSSAQSMGASFVTSGIDLSQALHASFQGVWSGGGAPNGTFTVEVSNDNVADPADVTNWTTYGGSSISITSDGDLGYSVPSVGYRFARVRYVRTSGTGTFNMQAVVKRDRN
jgi:hypothetical protein